MQAPRTMQALCMTATQNHTKVTGFLSYRIYKRLKAERDARVAEEEEHERLIDLMRAEQEEQRIAKEAEAQAAHREAMRADMAAANAQQLQFKVGLWFRVMFVWLCWTCVHTFTQPSNHCMSHICENFMRADR